MTFGLGRVETGVVLPRPGGSVRAPVSHRRFAALMNPVADRDPLAVGVRDRGERRRLVERGDAGPRATIGAGVHRGGWECAGQGVRAGAAHRDLSDGDPTAV